MGREEGNDNVILIIYFNGMEGRKEEREKVHGTHQREKESKYKNTTKGKIKREEMIKLCNRYLSHVSMEWNGRKEGRKEGRE